MVFAEPSVDGKVLNQIISNLSLGLIDMEDLDNQKVQAVLDAYKKLASLLMILNQVLVLILVRHYWDQMEN